MEEAQSFFSWNVDVMNRNHFPLLLISQTADFSGLLILILLCKCLWLQMEMPAEMVDIMYHLIYFTMRAAPLHLCHIGICA